MQNAELKNNSQFSIFNSQLEKKVMAKEATKSFVLRIDAEMMEAIERWAEDEFRSTNGQLQYIIAEALRKSGRIKKKKKSDGND